MSFPHLAALLLTTTAALSLAGCAADPERQARLATYAAVERAERIAGRELTSAEAHAAVAADQRARLVCGASGQMLRNLHPGNGRSLLELDAIAAGNQTTWQCFEVWQATGVIP